MAYQRNEIVDVLHIAPHLGGGVGTVVVDFLLREKTHKIITLEPTKDHKAARINASRFIKPYDPRITHFVKAADVVLVHWWDHPSLDKLFFSNVWPTCRLAFWCHKNYPFTPLVSDFPDIFVATSPVIKHFPCIWSTGDMEPYLEKPIKKRNGKYIIGYVGTVDYKKIHPDFIHMFNRIKNATFIVCGENKTGSNSIEGNVHFIGYQERVPWELFDIFAYPLRENHYGTSEQVLGEAMAHGIVPVVMDNPAESYIVKDGFNGIVAKSSLDFINATEALMVCENVLKTMSFNARSTARRLYSISATIESWKEVFYSLCQNPPTLMRNTMKSKNNIKKTSSGSA